MDEMICLGLTSNCLGMEEIYGFMDETRLAMRGCF